MTATALVLSLVGACVLLWARRTFVSVTVRGSSMNPALADGDRVLVRRTVLDTIEVGDVVVVRAPSPDTYVPGASPAGRAGHWLVKRVAATPGDPVPPDVAAAAGATAGSPVPGGRLVVLGDNAAASLDSRNCGFFDRNSLVGVVVRPSRHHATGSRTAPAFVAGIASEASSAPSSRRSSGIR
jgi:signal peptidase I